MKIAIWMIQQKRNQSLKRFLITPNMMKKFIKKVVNKYLKVA